VLDYQEGLCSVELVSQILVSELLLLCEDVILWKLQVV